MTIAATMTVPSTERRSPASRQSISRRACGDDADPYRPYYGLHSITRLEDAASSSYNALQFRRERLSVPLSLSGAYTYSHSIDDSSDRYDADFVNSYNLSAAGQPPASISAIS